MRNTLSINNTRMAGVGTAFPASVPASVKGWDAISSVANMPPDHAIQLDNFIARPGYLEIRRGSKVFASGVDTGAVETLLPYNAQAGANSKLFAIGGGTIYDITAGATATATSVTGWSNSRAQYENFTNAAGVTHLFVCNGVNTPVTYSTSWATAGISGVTQTDIVGVAGWKGRLMFVLNGSSKFAYLPVGAITGTAATFDLGSLMTKGGAIQAIGTWTVDTKQTVDEYVAFISTMGQVFVYQGTDPSNANTFALVGVYNMGAPIGRRCCLRISGNLWIITMDGVIPMTEMLAIDRASAPRVSITSMIMNAINQSVQAYASNWGWQFISYPRGTIAILNIPVAENDTSIQYVMNTITGAWSRFLDLDAQVWCLWNDLPYFGSTDGKVYQWDTGAGDYTEDENKTITATVQTAFNYFDTRGWKKRFTAIRPIITTDQTIVPGVGINVDFGTNGYISPPSVAAAAGAIWDVSKWDEVLWPITSQTIANWTTVEGIGQCASIVTQVITADNGNAAGVTMQLNGWDLTMEKGTGFY